MLHYVLTAATPVGEGGLRAATEGGALPPAPPQVLEREGVNVQMMSQGASKTNISLIVNDGEAKQAVRALHREFFE